LTELISATQSEQAEITKVKLLAQKTQALTAKAAAEKTLKAEAAEKKAAAEAKKPEQGEDDDEEEEAGDSFEKLTKALQNLKASKVPYHFIACDAKPYGLVVAKKNIKSSAQHKKELAKVAGGSTRPPQLGKGSQGGQ